VKQAEMTAEQLGQRQLFVTNLSSAGWNPGGWEALWEAGATLTPEAQAEYQTSSFKLRLGYHAEAGYVRLECDEIEGDTQLTFRFYPKANLDTVLETVVANQESLSAENFPELVKTMIPRCSLVLFEVSDEELVQLS
jgi:hypothetical protein